MKTYEQYYDLLKTQMTIDGVVNPRFYHSIGVAEMAVKLNKIHNLGLDENKLKIAGLMHDCAKLLSYDLQWEILENNETKKRLLEIKDVKSIWHSFAGMYYAKDFYKIFDKEILNAIYYHTTGCFDISLFSQIIFVSDYIEERTRKNIYSEIARNEVFKDLDQGTLKILENTISFLKSKNYPVDYLTNECLNYFKKKVTNKN